MGEMGRATCIVCGEEFDISDMEATFTGRPRYRCYRCVANGNKQAKARMDSSFAIRYSRRKKEGRWR